MNGEDSAQPLTVVDKRMVKRHNQVATQIPVLWKGLSPSDAT
jgi:hypothetical protein